MTFLELNAHITKVLEKGRKGLYLELSPEANKELQSELIEAFRLGKDVSYSNSHTIMYRGVTISISVDEFYI